MLAQFRLQHSMLLLIAHFQKAALLMSSDRLVEALKNLAVGDATSVRRFKRSIHVSFESVLRFTHRYWLHEVSEQAQVRALSHLCTTHLGLMGTVSTGFLGMNLLAEADAPMWHRPASFGVVFAVMTLLTFYTMGKSKALSDFLDALSNERMSFGDKLKALGGVWQRGAE